MGLRQQLVRADDRNERRSGCKLVDRGVRGARARAGRIGHLPRDPIMRHPLSLGYDPNVDPAPSWNEEVPDLPVPSYPTDTPAPILWPTDAQPIPETGGGGTTPSTPAVPVSVPTPTVTPKPVPQAPPPATTVTAPAHVATPSQPEAAKAGMPTWVYIAAAGAVVLVAAAVLKS